MLKKLFMVTTLLTTTQVFAQNIPPLPGPISPSLKDSETFLCDVASINEDPINRSENLWTTAARGGKYQAINPSKIRVMSQNEITAASDVFHFYRRYAAAAYIKSPMYDRGTRLTQKFVVSKCTIDPSRATRVELHSAPLNSYKKPLNEKDHLLIFLAFNKSTLTDEQIASIFSDKPFSSDAFERRDQIQSLAASAKAEAKESKNKLVILEGQLDLPQYNFDKKSFDLSILKQSAERYSYQAVTQGKIIPPNYELIVPASMLTYSPKSIDEAKRIERARSKSQFTKLRTYIQVKDASNSGGPTINATVAAIEVYSEDNQFLFRINAR